MDCALVDQEDKAVVEFSAQVSYYFGRQGGESWTEGSQDDESVFRVEQPGTYRLLIQGESGYGESAGPPGRGPPLRVEVRQNCGLARWHFLLAGLFGLAALIELCLVVWFESERWKHSDL